jgi:hypothetical protein
VSAHRHQHAAHIGVVDDGAGRRQRTVHRAALHAVTRVLDSLLVSAFGQRDALHAHAETRGVHHDEHVFQAAVFLANQRGSSTAVVAELQHRGRAGLDAQLVLDADAVHIVARAVRHHLWAQEQADALHALGRPCHARKHQVDDVVRHVVFAVGDEDLGAEKLEGAIRLRLCARAHGGQVRASLRLSQVHRARPRAFDHLGNEDRLLFVVAGGQQRLDGAVCQQRAQRKAEVGAVDHFAASSTNQLGQTLTAEFHRVLQALPATFGELPEGRLEAWRGRDHTVLERRRLLVAGPVQRCHHAFVELGAFLEHSNSCVVAGVFEPGQRGHSVNAGQLLHHEEHVLHRGSVCHVSSPDEKRAPDSAIKGALA